MYLFIFISTKICPHPKVKWYANAIFKVILFSFSLEILIDLKSILSCMWDTVSVTFHTGVTSVPCTCASSLYPTSAGPESSSHGSARVVPGSAHPSTPPLPGPASFSHGSAGMVLGSASASLFSASHFLPHWNCGLRRTRPPELSLKL